MNPIPESVGPYRIESEIGRGQMAVVYQAVDMRNSQQVALKILPPYFAHDPALVARFLREQRSVTKLSHPNIVSVYDIGESEGRYYISFELIEGQTLTTRIEQLNGPMPLDEVTRIISQIADALDHAHRNGFLHRDVKPSNILLADDGRVLLADFGVTQQLGDPRSEHTIVGYSVGTPAFMSPEQVLGDIPLDPRSDVYSLGVVAYTLLTGVQPFRSANFVSLLRAVAESLPPDPALIAPDLPLGVARVLQRVLAKRPDDRYDTAGEFARALKEGDSGSNTLTRDAISFKETSKTPRRRAEDRTRRFRVMPLLLTLLSLIVLVGLALALLRNGPIVPGVVETAPAVAAQPSIPAPTKAPTFSPTPTATPLGVGAPTPNATPTSPDLDPALFAELPTLEAPIPGATVVFRWQPVPALREDFSQPAATWQSVSDEAGWWRPGEGSYLLTVRSPATRTSLPLGLDVCDFALSVSIRGLIPGSDVHAGLMFRSHNPSSWYQVDVSPLSGYELSKTVEGVTSVLGRGSVSNGNESDPLRTDLSIAVSGSFIQVSINGNKQPAVEDSAITCGDIALYAVSGSTGSAEFAFDDFVFQPGHSDIQSVILQPYEDPASRFSLLVPRDWVSSTENAAFIISAPDAVAEVSVFELLGLEPNASAVDLAGILLKETQSLYRNLEMQEASTYTRKGVDSFRQRFEAQVLGVRVAGEVLVLVQGDRGYVLLHAVELEKEAALRPLMTYILESFQVHPLKPTSTPVPSATIIVSSPTASRSAVRTSTATPSGKVITDFESFGVWRRGAEPYGSFLQSRDVATSGSFSARLEYVIPAVQQNYVVFQRRPTAAIPGRPDALTINVYGDGSGSYLNAWIQDSVGEVRQFSFGTILHKDSWQPMVLILDTTAAWPQQNISGSDNGILDFPITLNGFVLDAVDESAEHRGRIYLDDLMVGLPEGYRIDQATSSKGSNNVGATATPAVISSPPPPPVSTTLSGHIAYTSPGLAGQSVFLLDVATRNTWEVFSGGHQADIRGNARIVVNGQGGGRDNLFTTAYDSSNTKETSRHPEDSYPHWSPSGRSIVFHSTLQGDGVERIYVQWNGDAAEEPAMLRVSNTDVMGRNATWLPNWRVAYSGCDYWSKGSKCGIWTIDTKTGAGPNQLTERSEDVSSDAHGDTLLYSSQLTGNWEIYAIPLNGGAPANLTQNPGQDVGATFSPDGRRIAFMSNRDGTWGIWVMNVEGSDVSKLIAVPGGFGSDWAGERLSWGP